MRRPSFPAALATAVVATLAAALLLGALPALGQGIEVTIDRPEATVQDQLVLSVKVEGSQNAVPQLPDLSAFRVYSRGQSSQFQMVNGRTSVAVVHTYLLLPKQPGSFTIGAAKVEIDGRIYESRPFEVRILEASAEPEVSQSVFLTATVSNTTPYVGEQVIYTWRFYRSVQVGDARLLSMSFEGFLAEDLGDVREYTTTRGGQRFVVNEIRKALFPQETGRLVIPPSQLQCQVVVAAPNRRRRSVFDEFFGRQQVENKILTSPEIPVEVRPLPAAPSGYSGLVGQFELASRINKRELRVGESATWVITVSGNGNVQMIGEPELPPLGRFKIYDDKPTSSVERNGSRLTGSRSYSKALVPLEAGELTVAPVRLTYFDPEAGTYRTASSAPIPLRVLPAEGEEELRLTESIAPSTGKVAVQILADDILPLYKELDAVEPPAFGQRPGAAWLATVAGPPLLYLGLLIADRRRRHRAENVGLLRRRGAFKKAKRGLAEVTAASREGHHRDAAQLASRLLREYVGDKVDAEGAALTPAEVDAELRGAGVDGELAAAARQLLELLEAAQYGGVPASEAEDGPGRLGDLLARLEREIGA